MSDFEFDPDAIGSLPAGLRAQRTDVLGATTLPAPDTGATTAATADAVRRIAGQAVDLGDRLDTLAADLEDCLTVYAETDDDVFHALELRMTGALS